MNKDYIIEFYVKNCIIWDNDTCLNKIIFKDCFGRIIIELILSDNDIVDLFKTYYEFVDTRIPISIYFDNNLQYGYYVYFIYNSTDKNMYLQIYQNELLRLSIAFNEEYFSELFDKMYNLFVDFC